jgi:hypothetical protein
MAGQVVKEDTRASEETSIHTRMLRIGLAEEDSRAYWAQADRHIPEAERVETALQERWFGSRTQARVRYLLNNLAARFDAFPGALEVLARWNPTDIADRTVICHWHVQLSDPLYREFTSSFLAARWRRPQPTIDRSATLRWVEQKTEGRWSSSTAQRMAVGLLATAAEAGLCDKTKDHRALHYPRVSDHALGYLLYLLRGLKFAGNLKENPYLESVGFDGDLWEQRVRKLPWLEYRRMSNVHDLAWHFDSLEAWGQEVFSR